MDWSAFQPSGALPMEAIVESAMKIEAGSSRWDAGSTRRAPRILIFHAASGAPPARMAYHRHAHRDAEGHLRQDHALAAVGHRGIDLDAAVHGPGCITIASGLARASFSAVSP